MKTNSRMQKIKSYFIELTIVTIGVLIALVISNFKENNQARKYYKASIETINNEIEANYSDLKGIIEKQIKFNDTLIKYGDSPTIIGEIIGKVGGIKACELSNTGLELYKRNLINSIDFEMMSTLNEMNYQSEIIDTKINRLIDFAYPNILYNTKESKTVLLIHIQDVLGSQKYLMKLYKDYIDKNIDTEDN